jgi:hypothetical protein
MKNLNGKKEKPIRLWMWGESQQTGGEPSTTDEYNNA